MRDSKRTHPQRRKNSSQARREKTDLEWIGGRLRIPLPTGKRPPPHSSSSPDELLIWFELPSELIVGAEVVVPASPVSLADSLLRTMKKPAAGVPRHPARIRVEDEEVATELRRVVPDVEVTVGPTPELAALIADLLAHQIGELFGDLDDDDDNDDSQSYFEDGRVSKKAIDGLFRAAATLYERAPWEVAWDSQVLRLDIPALGVAGACVSILGAAGQSYGLLIVPSLVAFLALQDRSEALALGEVDLGTDLLALNFEAVEDLPASMQREITQHGWHVAGPLAYPRLEHRATDGSLHPLRERDVQIATACAAAVARFFAQHSQMFEDDSPEPITESYSESGWTVHLMAPYEPAEDDFAAGPPIGTVPHQRTEPKVSRNAPCPCGSGQKYKKCCQGKERDRPAPAGKDTQRLPRGHAIDARLALQLNRFHQRHFPKAWDLAAEDFDDADEALQLFGPWLFYDFLIDGRTIAEHFLAQQGASLSIEERAWLHAQGQAWLSVWEVVDVEPGQKIALKDLLSGEERAVKDATASQMLRKRDTLLARVVDYEDESVLCGCHPIPLSPLEAAEVVQRAQSKLRRKTAVPVERLRDEPFGRFLIARWEDAVDALA